MAALFWRSMIGCQLLVAAACALAGWVAYENALSAVLIGLTVVGVLQLLFVAVLTLTARSGPSAQGSWVDTWHGLRALGTEAVQFGRAQIVMGAESWLRRDDGPVPAASPARPVLLIHGILCNRAIWRPLARRLREAGFAPVAAINLEPLDADIDAFAASAERELLALSRASRGAPVAIVAHSMGGLVARSLLRSLGPHLVGPIVTVASPHHGSDAARWLSLPAARQMRPGSTWLCALNAEQEERLAVPVTCIYGREDVLVVPARSAILAGAQSHEVRGVGHFGLLRAHTVQARILEALGQEASVHGIRQQS